MIQIALGGVVINDETLAMDVIHEVGPGGAYISHEQSLRYMKSQSRVNLFDRHSRNDWVESTQGKSVRDRAYEKAIEILENHESPALPGAASETINEIVEEYEKELKKDQKN